MPYVDFYEHHFPLSYVLHAPLVAADEGFPERALRLRSAVLIWLAGLALATGAATGFALANPFAGILAAFVPFATGFGLMSAVDYRADGFAAFTWLLCLLALEANRVRGRADLAIVAGGLATSAVFMTQKMVVLAGAALALQLGLDAWRRLRGVGGAPLVSRPGIFCSVALGLGLALLAVGAAFGMLAPGFDVTILQAIAHEDLYPAVSVTKWLAPFFAETWPSTIAIGSFAIAGLALPGSATWRIPVAVALVGGALMRGQYPYNYVWLSIVLTLMAVRGFAALVERMPLGRGVHWRPLLYLVPLLLLPEQLGFIDERTGNGHQLHVLRKIERFTGPDDVVIDGAGGALFRDHASYYWYHGDAHRILFEDYFREELVGDYRASGALFWIRDFRQAKLPNVVKEYFASHYVKADGPLYGLGFGLPAAPEVARLSLDVVRAGAYWVYAAPGERVAASGGGTRLEIDGEPVSDGPVWLGIGAHEIRLLRGAPAQVLTPLPREAFLDRFEANRPYAPLFEFRRRAPASAGGRKAPG